MIFFVNIFRYGSPRLAQRLANFTLKAMIHLSINEFCGAEKEEKFGIQVMIFILFVVDIFDDI